MTRLPLALGTPVLMLVAYLGIRLVGGPVLFWVALSAGLWILLLTWYVRSIENQITEHFAERARLEDEQQLTEAGPSAGIAVERSVPRQRHSTRTASDTEGALLSCPICHAKRGLLAGQCSSCGTRFKGFERLDRVAHLFALWIVSCMGWGLIVFSVLLVSAGQRPSLELQLATFIGAVVLGSITAGVLGRWLSRWSRYR